MKNAKQLTTFLFLFIAVLSFSQTISDNEIIERDIPQTEAKVIGSSHVQSYFEMSIDVQQDIASYKIISSGGQIVTFGRVDEYEAQHIVVNVSDFPSGVYFVRVFEQSTIPKVLKFVKV
ncbi:MAG: T9SS type A sorting domain-containing protein [Flavobacteriales bacterium]|nr:T9SS type A sorting domain-containing protein [Flavobacteriales bacterium]